MFQLFTFEQLRERIEGLNITRPINAVHIHHTWRPNHSNFTGSNGVQLQKNMRDYHVKTNKWADIGQHFTLLPNGDFVTGRDLNKDPASIAGFNKGAICLEMLGDFDIGRDKFTGKQEENAYMFTGLCMKLFGIGPSNIIFHREKVSGQTCPGNSINQQSFIIQSNLRYERFKNEGGSNMFNDMDKVSGWAENGVDRMYKTSIMQGDENRNFNPQQAVTREELAVTINNLLRYIGK